MYGWFLVTFASVCALTAFVYVPVFYKMELKSTYDYLRQRFGEVARMFAVTCFLVQTALYLGIVIYAPALALSNTTGMNLWGAVVGTGAVCTIYTTLGGMKAVIWTSVFQALVMLAGFIAVIIYGVADMGWNQIYSINKVLKINLKILLIFFRRTIDWIYSKLILIRDNDTLYGLF